LEKQPLIGRVGNFEYSDRQIGVAWATSTLLQTTGSPLESEEKGKLVDIEVLDHLIIGRGWFVSLKERGLGL
jgi:hypothetical protein